jgi:hypothetical protein
MDSSEVSCNSLGKFSSGLFVESTNLPSDTEPIDQSVLVLQCKWFFGVLPSTAPFGGIEPCLSVDLKLEFPPMDVLKLLSCSDKTMSGSWSCEICQGIDQL